MAAVTIRNLDDWIVQKLKKRAAANKRSFEAELREILLQAAGRPSRAELLELADRIAAMTHEGVKQTDSAELLREDRDK